MRNKRIIIVGGGMAGLTAAAYLSKEKYEVQLFEKNEKIGGLVSTFERDGFSFDTGPRAFVNSGMVKPIFEDLDIAFETVENKISLCIEDQKIRIDSMDALEDYKEMLIRLYPESSMDIEIIIQKIKKLSGYTKTLYEFDNPYFVDYFSDKKFLVTKFLPWTVKLFYVIRKFKHFDKPMEKYLRGKTKNHSLIDILTQFFFKKTPTYFALGYFYVWLDYFYPLGGTGVLPELLSNKISSDGGRIKFNTEVTSIVPSESFVVDSNGEKYEYDQLVWAADLKTLYRVLDKNKLSGKVMRKIDLQKEKVFEAKPAESSFILNLAVNRPTSYFAKRGGAHCFYTPSKEGLGDVVEKKKEEFIKNFQSYTREDILSWLDSFCKLSTYEISIPALRDKSLAPEGKTGIMISCLFDFELMNCIDKAGWADEFKNEMNKRIIRIFSQSFYIEIEKDVMFSFSTTPVSINKLIGSSEGAIVGWSFETDAPVFNDLSDMPKCAQTPIPNVYQAGQWAYAPAGVPIAMLTGWHASQEIIKSERV